MHILSSDSPSNGLLYSILSLAFPVIRTCIVTEDKTIRWTFLIFKTTLETTGPRKEHEVLCLGWGCDAVRQWTYYQVQCPGTRVLIKLSPVLSSNVSRPFGGIIRHHCQLYGLPWVLLVIFWYPQNPCNKPSFWLNQCVNLWYLQLRLLFKLKTKTF